MPVWLTPLLIKYVLPYIVQELVKSEIIPALAGAAIVDFESFKQALKNLKTYREFPEQRSNFGSH